MKKIRNFIENLDLSSEDKSFRFPKRATEDTEGLEGTEPESAVLNYKSLQSFAAGVSKQRQTDVLNSMLLAQRGATKFAPEDDQLISWYKKYFEILDKIGWVFEGREFMQFKTQHSLFEIDKALLSILSSVITGSQITIIMKTLESIKSLGDNDKRFLAFEKNTHSLRQGNFQLGLATETDNTLSISGSAFTLNTNKTISKILFFNSDKDSSDFRFCQIKATLNDEMFSNVRELIKEKLGDVSSFIADLEI